MARDIRYSGKYHRGRSEQIWGKFSPDRLLAHPHEGVIAQLFPPNFGGAVGSNVGHYLGNRSYEDTSASIQAIATLPYPAVTMATPATDNLEAWIGACGGTGTIGKIDPSDATVKVMAFEARVRANTLTAQNLFFGLAEEGFAAHNAITDSAALADKDLIGFHVAEGTPTRVDFVYRKAGEAVKVLIQGVHTLVADKFVKLGFVYDYQHQPDELIKIYVDGQEQSTYVTRDQILDTDFPKGEELAPVAGLKNGEAGIKSVTFSFADGGALYAYN